MFCENCDFVSNRRLWEQKLQSGVWPDFSSCVLAFFCAVEWEMLCLKDAHLEHVLLGRAGPLRFSEHLEIQHSLIQIRRQWRDTEMAEDKREYTSMFLCTSKWGLAFHTIVADLFIIQLFFFRSNSPPKINQRERGGQIVGCSKC